MKKITDWRDPDHRQWLNIIGDIQMMIHIFTSRRKTHFLKADGYGTCQKMKKCKILLICNVDCPTQAQSAWGWGGEIHVFMHDLYSLTHSNDLVSVCETLRMALCGWQEPRVKVVHRSELDGCWNVLPIKRSLRDHVLGVSLEVGGGKGHMTPLTCE